MTGGRAGSVRRYLLTTAPRNTPLISMAISPRRYTQQEIDDLIGCPKLVWTRTVDCPSMASEAFELR